MINFKLQRLLNGETFETTETGNSMVPRIYSKQPHTLEPASWETVEIGDVVYAKVKGSFLTHLVKAKNPDKGCLISNNKGKENGWTKNVYGKVIKIG